MALATKVGGFDVLCSNIELDNFDEMEKSSKSIAKKLNSVYYDLDNDDTSYNKIVVFIDRSPAECYNSFRVLWIGEALLPQRRFLGGSNHGFFVEMLIS